MQRAALAISIAAVAGTLGPTQAMAGSQLECSENAVAARQLAAASTPDCGRIAGHDVSATFATTAEAPQSGTAPLLFAGTAVNPSGTNNPAYLIDTISSAATPGFAGRAVWGATFNVASGRVLFTSDGGVTGGAELYEWYLGQAVPSLVGTITSGGVDFRIDGLAISNGTLYGSRAANLDDGIYEIDMYSLEATLVYPFADSVSGIDADPATGILYGVNDTTQSLVRIDPEFNTMTTVAAYPDAAEDDIDGLAVGDGKAYLIPDDDAPGLIYVYDLASGSWDAPLTAPWGTVADTFSGGALVVETRPLFAGTALNGPGANNPAIVADVTTGVSALAFGGRAVWGATADNDRDRVLFTSDGGAVPGADLYEWQRGQPAPNLVGTITYLGNAYRIDGLAIVDGVLWASFAGGSANGIYRIDLGTLEATLVYPFDDSVSGIDADPATGILYGVNDTTQSLVRIDSMQAVMTSVAVYPDPAENDIDGLAVDGGRAYLIPDDNDPGLIYVYNLRSGSWEDPLPAPWGATADTFSGGALSGDRSLWFFKDGFESGTTDAWSAISP